MSVKSIINLFAVLRAPTPTIIKSVRDIEGMESIISLLPVLGGGTTATIENIEIIINIFTLLCWCHDEHQDHKKRHPHIGYSLSVYYEQHQNHHQPFRSSLSKLYEHDE